jgi:hypothetical protein
MLAREEDRSGLCERKTKPPTFPHSSQNTRYACRVYSASAAEDPLRRSVVVFVVNAEKVGCEPLGLPNRRLEVRDDNIVSELMEDGLLDLKFLPEGEDGLDETAEQLAV